MDEGESATVAARSWKTQNLLSSLEDRVWARDSSSWLTTCPRLHSLCLSFAFLGLKKTEQAKAARANPRPKVVRVGTALRSPSPLFDTNALVRVLLLASAPNRSKACGR